MYIYIGPVCIVQYNVIGNKLDCFWFFSSALSTLLLQHSNLTPMMALLKAIFILFTKE